MQFHPVPAHILLFDKFSALPKAEGHDVSYKICTGDNACTDVRLFDVVDFHCIWHAGGVVDFNELLVFVVNVIAYVRYRCDDVHVEFAVQAFLYDFHVQESEKSASETESKCYG